MFGAQAVRFELIKAGQEPRGGLLMLLAARKSVVEYFLPRSVLAVSRVFSKCG
jgi:hypothetical protein